MTHLCMNTTSIRTITQLKYFLKPPVPDIFQIDNRMERLEFIQRTLLSVGYREHSKKDKGYVRQYISLFTGYSSSQITRLVAKHYAGTLLDVKYERNKFPVKYTQEDIRLLAEADIANEIMHGAATKENFKREYEIFGDKRYEDIANLSVSHLYNLR